MHLFIDNNFIPTLKPFDRVLIALSVLSLAITDLAIDDDDALSYLSEEHGLDRDDIDDDCRVAAFRDNVLYVSTDFLVPIFEEEYGNEYEDVLQRIIANLSENVETLNLTARGILVTPVKSEESEEPAKKGPLSVAELQQVFEGSPLASALNRPALIIGGTPVRILKGEDTLYDIDDLFVATYSHFLAPAYIHQVLVANRTMFTQSHSVKKIDGRFYATLRALHTISNHLTPVSEVQPLFVDILTNFEATQMANYEVDFLGNPV